MVHLPHFIPKHAKNAFINAYKSIILSNSSHAF
nr:MAG TPA: hypothetical protein [Caudoviricetes sp.]